ncbi:BON1-associated protein 2-like [Rhodamnia argentea]|uniref:BON1-associated protein 2-like n=1 Tax=Rhodamnia argentea TaxID=178133 RepID=A0ABM3H7E5_9MYRT|nr:BON1-associated protein 2-like [Rhodamnia argentea]
MSDMANTHKRSLEVTVISGEDLHINDRPIKNNAFVTVTADTRSSPSSYDSTKLNAPGESYPFWNEKLQISLPAGSRHVVIEVRRWSSSGRDKLVGAAWIPVSDFLGCYTPEDYLHFLSYRLRDANGQRNGIVNISVRVVTSSSSTSVPEFGITVDREKTGRAVTGMPVWYPNQCKS